MSYDSAHRSMFILHIDLYATLSAVRNTVAIARKEGESIELRPLRSLSIEADVPASTFSGLSGSGESSRAMTAVQADERVHAGDH